MSVTVFELAFSRSMPSSRLFFTMLPTTVIAVLLSKTVIPSPCSTSVPNGRRLLITVLFMIITLRAAWPVLIPCPLSVTRFCFTTSPLPPLISKHSSFRAQQLHVMSPPVELL